jgi:CheY-like chemotaxis protein
MSPTTTILLIDDDPDIRDVVVEALTGEGYRVQAAANGVEALALLRDPSPRPDLILLDLMMPVMDGGAFLAECQQSPALATIPVVIFSAYGAPSAVAAPGQVVGYLKKPLRLSDLFEAVQCATRAVERG